MKSTIISFYTDLVNKAIKNNNTLKKQCEIENLNVNTAYKTLSSIKHQDTKTKEEEDLIHLYETLKEVKTEIETDDRATISEIRDEFTNEIKAYKFEIEHVRPHGAMYRRAGEDFRFATVLARAIQKTSQ